MPDGTDSDTSAAMQADGRTPADRHASDDARSIRPYLISGRGRHWDRLAGSRSSGELEPPPVLDLPTADVLHRMIEGLRSGGIPKDPSFDAIFPERIRMLSSQHWSSIEVVRDATAWLVQDQSVRVLDVGSGPGKFCLAGALVSPGHFTGAERRGYLVELARTLARRYDITRTRFLHSDIKDLDWRQFDAFYLYNPFGENRFGNYERIDNCVDFSEERFFNDVGTVQQRLTEAPHGTRVVTYNGLGGRMPKCYQRVRRHVHGIVALEFWEKMWSPVPVARLAGSRDDTENGRSPDRVRHGQSRSGDRL